MLFGRNKINTEKELVTRCKKHDKKALEQLYKDYGALLKGVSYRYVLDKTTAEDIVHEGYIKIFGSIQFFEYNGEGSLKAWMTRIIINLSIDYLKIKNKESAIYIDDNTTELIEYDSEEETVTLIENSRIKGITNEVLLQMLDELPEKTRIVFNLFAIEQLSHKEIGDILGIAEEASRTRLKRARKQLQEKLSEFCQIERQSVVI